MEVVHYALNFFKQWHVAEFVGPIDPTRYDRALGSSIYKKFGPLVVSCSLMQDHKMDGHQIKRGFSILTLYFFGLRLDN